MRTDRWQVMRSVRSGWAVVPPRRAEAYSWEFFPSYALAISYAQRISWLYGTTPGVEYPAEKKRSDHV